MERKEDGESHDEDYARASMACLLILFLAFYLTKGHVYFLNHFKKQM